MEIVCATESANPAPKIYWEIVDGSKIAHSKMYRVTEKEVPGDYNGHRTESSVYFTVLESMIGTTMNCYTEEPYALQAQGTTMQSK